MKKIVLLSLFGCLLASAVKAQNTPAFDGRQMIDVAKVPSWNFSSRPAGWYRIAKTSFRGNATFELREDADHSTLRFQVGISYNSNGGASLTITSHSFYGNPTFLKLRLLTLPGSYDSSFLEVYVDPHNNDGNTFNAYLINPMANGDWSLLNWENGSIPSGYQVAEFNVDKLFAVGNVAQGITLAVNRNGNVGIGTTNPNAALEIFRGSENLPALMLNSSGSGWGSGMVLKNTAAKTFGIYSGIDFRLHFSDNEAGVDRMTIDEIGKVGIGTASPLEKLTVLGNVLASVASNEGPSLVLENPNKTASNMAHRWTLYNMTGAYGNSLQFWSYSQDGSKYGPKLTVADNGNIGVGTTNPMTKLHVQADANTSGAPANAQLFVGGATNAEKRLSLAYNTSSNYGEIQSQAYEGAYTPITLNPNGGNVLVGKTAQTNTAYKLDVNGKVRANEIVVNTTGADFVFEENYRLRPLAEVEKFVKENRHLPEIPTAKAMQREGVGVSELQTKLLQKVEELTLYLIEKEKELQNSNKRIQDLEAEQKEIKTLLKKLTDK